MREGAHGDEVDAGLGDGADRLERDAAGGLELRPPGGELDRTAQEHGRHVVEQDSVGAGGKRLADLVERVALDLDLEAGAGGAQPLDGLP